MTLRYKIFGCKTNKYYTEKWLGSEELSGKEGIFIASCVVTDKAKSKWLRYIRQEIKTLTQNEKIYLSGCGTIKDGKVDENFYTQYPELAQYREKIELLPEDPSSVILTKESVILSETKNPLYINRLQGILRPAYGTQNDNRETTTATRQGRNLQSLKSSFAKIFTRKYLVVQMGCDNFCTFCLTVQARGRHHSRPIEEIITEINEFVESGGKEVVITGINIGAWGASNSNNINESKFPNLIKTILEQTTIDRIRISSLGVEFVSDEMIELFAHPRVIAHAHLSIQSGSDKILRSMNRHYTREKLLDVLEKLSNIKRSDGVIFGVGADLIVGFPGETPEDFTDTLDIVKNYNIVKVHAFPFSPHTSGYTVPAGKFDLQIPEDIKQARLHELIEAGNARRLAFLQENSGKTFRLLAEKIGSNTFTGWSENYIELDEKNFTPNNPRETIKRGEIIEGIYHFDSSHSEKHLLDF